MKGKGFGRIKLGREKSTGYGAKDCASNTIGKNGRRVADLLRGKDPPARRGFRSQPLFFKHGPPKPSGIKTPGENPPKAHNGNRAIPV